MLFVNRKASKSAVLDGSIAFIELNIVKLLGWVLRLFNSTALYAIQRLY